MKKDRVLYYSDLVNDDFSKVDFNGRKLPDDFIYISKNPFRRAFNFFLFHVLAKPAGIIYAKLLWNQKIVNRKAIKPYKKTGYFMYANHTRMGGDAFTPGLVSWPEKPYIITNNDSASNFMVEFFTTSLGSLPLPSSIKGFKGFHNALKELTAKGHPICIYPEAHIWPYYTKIRPFKDASFHYPAEFNKPVFTFTATYQKRKFIKRPKCTVYVDGPFFPDKDKTIKENQRALRDMCFNAMEERSKNSNYEYIKYIYKPKNDNND